MDRFLDFVGLRRQIPQGGQQPQRASQRPGVTPIGGHGHIGPAPALTPTMQAMTKSAEVALQSVAETKTLLENLTGEHFDALALEKIEEPKIRWIATQLFGHSPLMAPIGCKEDGVVYCSFLVPTQQIDYRDVLYLAEALEIAAPDIAAELCASAAMGPGLWTSDRISLLEKCAALTHEKDVVLCPFTLDELIKGLARACENGGQKELVKLLFQLIRDSVSESKQVECLTENLIGAFNKSLLNDDQHGAQKAVDVLKNLPYAHASHAVAQLLADQEAIIAQYEWDKAEQALKATGFRVRIENVRGDMPKKLLNTGGEVDCREKRNALVNYAIKLAAIPGFEQWKFCMFFDFLQKDASLLDLRRSTLQSALQSAHCQVIACFIRDSDKNTKVRLEIFREDFAERLRASLGEVAGSLMSFEHDDASLALKAWADTLLDCILTNKALPNAFPSELNYLEARYEVGKILDLFVMECLSVCAYAAIAPMPELLEPVLKLIHYTCFNFDARVVAVCTDVANNPNVTDRLRETVIRMLDFQVNAPAASHNSKVAEFSDASDGLLFTRVAKAMALFDAETDGEERVIGLSLKSHSFYWDRKDQRGFSSKNTPPQIAAHMIEMSRSLRAGIGSKAFHEEMLGEYLYRFMRAGTDMQSLVKRVLAELVNCLHHEFSSIILGATHNGEPAQVHALLQLSLECNFDEVKDLANLVSDLLLELAQAGHFDPLQQAIELIRKKSNDTLEIWAVTYVRAAQRNQLMLAKLMRREILHLDLKSLFDDGNFINHIKNMTYRSIATERHDNPRRPSLHRDDQSLSKISMERVINKLMRLLMFRK